MDGMVIWLSLIQLLSQYQNHLILYNFVFNILVLYVLAGRPRGLWLRQAPSLVIFSDFEVKYLLFSLLLLYSLRFLSVPQDSYFLRPPSQWIPLGFTTQNSLQFFRVSFVSLWFLEALYFSLDTLRCLSVCIILNLKVPIGAKGLKAFSLVENQSELHDHNYIMVSRNSSLFFWNGRLTSAAAKIQIGHCGASIVSRSVQSQHNTLKFY